MGSTTTDVRLAKKVFLRAMPLRFSLTREARILTGWRMANEASGLNSALLRTFSLFALFFSREGKGINALDQIYVCPCFNFPNYDACMECRVVNSTSQIFLVLLWLDERLPQQCAIIGECQLYKAHARKLRCPLAFIVQNQLTRSYKS